MAVVVLSHQALIYVSDIQSLCSRQESVMQGQCSFANESVAIGASAPASLFFSNEMCFRRER